MTDISLINIVVREVEVLLLPVLCTRVVSPEADSKLFTLSILTISDEIDDSLLNYVDSLIRKEVSSQFEANSLCDNE